ncbi:MAG TPA: hypothetical protein VFE47_03190 [Tepidisphaeraceae bacterium]|nr:hypothetical protein [Tepidisphaeraceae bacterium]
MVLPLLLIIVAGLAGGAVAYGTYAEWMRYPHGLEIILWSRRLQWPLVSLSLLACIVLMAMVISGRRRAWWLIGLAPVLALFAHRFTIGPAAGRMTVAENPAFVAVADSKIPDEEWVVGLSFGDDHYAYPYASLFSTPVVIQADHDKRMMLIWSAYANRALAVAIDQELKGRDLDIVSTPANALLIYNSRHGQFINGLTGETTHHERPIGFATSLPIPTSKMRWKDWRLAHPDTKVFAQIGPTAVNAPTQPIQPAWPMPPMSLDHPASLRVAVVGVSQPIAIDSAQVTATPLNASADDVPVALFREEADGPIRAFDRRTYDHSGKLDLILKLAPNLLHRRHPLAFFLDLSSNSGWNADGVCVDAPAEAKYLKGKKLEPVAVDDDLPLGVMKFWYPDLKWQIAPAAPIAVDVESETDTNHVATRKPRRPRKPKPAPAAR